MLWNEGKHSTKKTPFFNVEAESGWRRSNFFSKNRIIYIIVKLEKNQLSKSTLEYKNQRKQNFVILDFKSAPNPLLG